MDGIFVFLTFCTGSGLLLVCIKWWQHLIKSEFHFSFVCKDIFLEAVETDKISDEYLVFRVQRGA